jgi:hypothetical protein
MGLRARRRNVVVWSSSGGRDRVRRHRLAAFARPASPPRLRRFLRVSGLLTAIGLLRFCRAVRLRWRPVLAGVALTTTGVVLRDGPGGLAFLSGVLFLYAALVMPADAGADRQRLSALERELAGYSTPAQRRDLEATLDRYPDADTGELRDILARQAAAAHHSGIPGLGPPPFTMSRLAIFRARGDRLAAGDLLRQGLQDG